MSRIANQPIELPSGTEVQVKANLVTVKGPKGTLEMDMHHLVSMKQDNNQLLLSAVDSSKLSKALSGTMRALLANHVEGVSKGHEKKLELLGVGYRAQVQGKKVNLTVGYSHPVAIDLPEGITATSQSPTELTIAGIDKQVVGQVAANIRKIRPPEPYKGKGIRYSGEYIKRKDAKKK